MQEISRLQVSILNKTKGKYLGFLFTGLIYLSHKCYLNPVAVVQQVIARAMSFVSGLTSSDFHELFALLSP